MRLRAFFQGKPEHDPLPPDAAHAASDLLVVGVERAPEVAVGEKDALAAQHADGGVPEERRADLAREALAHHEVAVAVHDV